MAAALPSWAYVVIWIVLSCCMIMFNKAVLSSYLDFPFPMFLTSWHMFVATAMTQLLSKTTDRLEGVAKNVVQLEHLKTKFLPVAVCYAFSLVLSNKAYIYLSVSYLQMLKAFTPVAVLLFSVCFGLEKPSFIELVVVSLICIGVAITTVGETMFSWTGFVLQTLAIGFEASRLVLTGVTLKELKLDSLSTLYYIAPLCFCCILPAHLYFEFSSLPWDIMLTTKFAGIMAASGAVAFGLNIAVVALINNKSALVLTLAGIIKDILLVVLSVMVFGSPVTPLQYFGYSVALLGLNAHKEYKKSPETAAKTVAAIFPWCPKWCAT